MGPLVIPVFITHLGCPHRCIFCDQHVITGRATPGIGPADVAETIEQWLDRPQKEDRSPVQVAFYGGSFTGLPLQKQEELLRAVNSYTRKGLVDTIRLSTRPDYVNEKVIALLKKYSVSTVELGVQSLVTEVLNASNRGHTAAESEKAARQLKDNGFTVGIQLMCGLPGETTGKLLETAQRVTSLAPDFVRIYPVLVIKGSGLEKLYSSGKYKPLSMNRAIALSSRMKKIFDSHSIRTVRIGLQTSEELADRVVAGPYHPAFGELVASRALFKRARELLRGRSPETGRCLVVAGQDESAFRGPGNVNMKRLARLGLLEGIELIFDREKPRNALALL